MNDILSGVFVFSHETTFLTTTTTKETTSSLCPSSLPLSETFSPQKHLNEPALPLCKLPPQSSSVNYSDTQRLVTEMIPGFSAGRMKLMTLTLSASEGQMNQWETAASDPMAVGEGTEGRQNLKRSEATNVRPDTAS